MCVSFELPCTSIDTRQIMIKSLNFLHGPLSQLELAGAMDVINLDSYWLLTQYESWYRSPNLITHSTNSLVLDMVPQNVNDWLCIKISRCIVSLFQLGVLLLEPEQYRSPGKSVTTQGQAGILINITSELFMLLIWEPWWRD